MAKQQPISTKPVKGVRDYFPEDLRLRHWLFGLWRDVAERFGFEEYEACVRIANTRLLSKGLYR